MNTRSKLNQEAYESYINTELDELRLLAQEAQQKINKTRHREFKREFTTAFATPGFYNRMGGK